MRKKRTDTLEKKLNRRKHSLKCVWHWYVSINMIISLEILHVLQFIRTERFVKWVYFRRQM